MINNKKVSPINKKKGKRNILFPLLSTFLSTFLSKISTFSSTFLPNLITAFSSVYAALKLFPFKSENITFRNVRNKH